MFANKVKIGPSIQQSVLGKNNHVFYQPLKRRR